MLEHKTQTLMLGYDIKARGKGIVKELKLKRKNIAHECIEPTPIVNYKNHCHARLRMRHLSFV